MNTNKGETGYENRSRLRVS